MKKTLAVIMALCLALAGFAMAETVEAINWADVEPTVTENGLEGDFYELNAVAVKLWVPSVYEYVEPTDEEVNDGLICKFEASDSVIYTQYLEGEEGAEMEDVIAGLTEAGATDIERCTLNGLDAVSYSIPDTDAVFVVFLTDAGNFVQFLFTPVSVEALRQLAMIVTASIQPAA